jgi:PAS domain S-box-containing protein
MGRDPPSDALAATLALFGGAPDEPLSTAEVADALDLPRRTADDRLSALVDRGDLQTKTVGASVRVWWRPGVPAADAAPALDDGVFRAVFDEAFDAMILADDSGTWVEVNSAASDLFGLPREELVGQSAAAFAPDDYDVEAAWAEFLASDRDRGLYPFVRADGEERLAEFAATPDIRPGVHLSILRDVTEREQTAAELARLNHLNTLVRGVDQATTRAGTERALATDICDSLLASDNYQYAALCTVDSGDWGVDPLATAGRDDLTAAIETAGLPALDPELARRSVETETVQVTRAPVDDAPPDGWLAMLTDHGVRSVAVVPLVHDGAVHGVLGIASTRRDAFDDEECTVLRELGQTVAYGLATLARHSLLDQEALVVTLQSRELVAPLAAITDVEGATVTLDEVVALADGTVSYYTLEGLDPEPVFEYLDTVELDVDARLLGQVEDTAWLEFRGYASPVATIATQFGGRIVRGDFEGGAIAIDVEVPTGTDVQALVETFESVAPDVTVVAQDHRHVPDTSHRDVLAAFGETLTDRQRTALELAVYSGYFEWPRQTTGEQLAALLDVHPSTFHYHLRVAERKLFHALLDAGVAVADDST